MRRMATEKQKEFFNALFHNRKLILVMKSAGCAVNLVGNFSVRRYGEEDRLDLEEGTSHVHMDWSKLTHITHVADPKFYDICSFFHKDTEIFKLLSMDGTFDSEVVARFPRP